MLSLASAIRQAKKGSPLPEVFPSWTAHDLRLMRGELTTIAGRPNSGKSMLGLFLARAYAEAGERVLYFSADSGEADQISRAAAMLSGHASRDVREALGSGGEAYYEDVLSDLPTTFRFDFRSSPSLGYIEEGLLAYDELFGVMPTAVFIDNLMDVEGGGDEGASEKHGLIEIQRTFKYWGREYGIAFIVMHHMSEAGGKPHLPAAGSQQQQKVSEIPAVIVSVAYNDATREFGIAGVKNRHGVADKAALHPFFLIADFDRCRFYSDRYEATVGGMAL